MKATLSPVWTKGESFTLARYNKNLHGPILIELWDYNLVLPPSFMGQIPLDLSAWSQCNGSAVWTKLESRGVAGEEVGGELLVQVSFSQSPSVVYESPLWKPRKFKGKKLVYAVLYSPSDLVLYRDVTCSKELKRLCLREGKSAVTEGKGGALAVANAPPAGKVTLTGRACFTAEWWRVLAPFVKASAKGAAGNNNNNNTGRLYGRSLADMAADGAFGADGVTMPAFLGSLFELVEAQGLETEGVFRLSGTKGLIDEGVRAIEGGKVFSAADNASIHDVTGLIKLFFRRLPEPLLTFGLYTQFIDAANMAGTVDGKARAVELVAQLPPVNRALAAALFALLAKVAARSDVNKMTPSNLAIVFAPSILSPQTQNALLTLTDLNSAQTAVEFLIVDAVEALAAAEESREAAPAAELAAAAAAPGGLRTSQRMRQAARVERRSTMLAHIAANKGKARPVITMEDPVKEMEADPRAFEEKARVLFEGYDDDGNKFLDADEFALFFIDLIRVYSLSYITRDDVLDIMERISDGDMKITFEQFLAWWTEFNRSLQKD